MKLKRYYLHGDQKESSLDMFYCARCDVFFAKDHFQSCSSSEDKARLRSDLKGFRKYIKPKSNWRRSDVSANLFDGGAL